MRPPWTFRFLQTKCYDTGPCTSSLSKNYIRSRSRPFNFPPYSRHAPSQPRSPSHACFSIGARQIPTDFNQRPASKAAFISNQQFSCQTFLRILLTRNALKTSLGVTERIKPFDMSDRCATGVATLRNRCCAIHAKSRQSQLR